MRHPRILIVAVALTVVALAAVTAVLVRPDDKSHPIVAGRGRTHVRSDDTPATTVALDLGVTSGSTTTTSVVPTAARRTSSSTTSPKTPLSETTTPPAPSGARCATPGTDRLAFVDVQRANELQVGYALSILDLSTHASKVVAINSDFYPSWPADGCELVTDVQGRVTRFGIDGTTSVVSPEGSQDRWASVSPDGRSIAFITANALWVMEASGSNRRHLADLGTANYLPSWSPDSSTIAYEAQTSSGYQVFTIRSDGTAKRQLTNGPATIEFPTWSPDGSQIGFTQSGGPQTMGIFTVHPDGSSPQKRADYSTDWRWSADGARIVSSQPMQSNNGGQLTFNVTVTTLATGAKQAFPEGYNAAGVTFTPSGNAVVFAGACEGHDNSLCRLDLGSGETTLLVDYAGSGRPIFAPR